MTLPFNVLRLETLEQTKKKLNNLLDNIVDFNITNTLDYMIKETWEALKTW